MIHPTPLVSVIIPCYQQAHFLGEAIESVLAQTYPHYEIIVIDDGSPDNTAEVAGRYSELRYIRQQNQGLAGARNAGLRACKGEYVVFLDADDRLLPVALATGVGVLNEHPECAFVYGHARLIDVSGSPLPSNPCPVVDDLYLALLQRNLIYSPGQVMYRRDIMDNISGFDGRVAGAADFDLNLRLSRENPTVRQDRFIFEYRRHDAGMSRNSALMLKHTMMVYRKQWAFIRGNKPREAAYNAGRCWMQLLYGERLINEVGDRMRVKEWREALTGMWMLLRYYPHGFTERAIGKITRFVLRDKII